MSELPWAENVNYWKTSRSGPDIWIDKTIRQIKKLGGEIFMEAFGKDASGRSGFMLSFAMGADQFKVVWPVLPSKSGNERAARIQAATMLYHDVKAKCISATVIGTRSAFFSYLMLPDGRTAVEVSTDEIAEGVPTLFARPLLISGEK